MWTLKVWASIPHRDSEFFICSTLVMRWKNIFLYFFTKLKTYHLLFYLYELHRQVCVFYTQLKNIFNPFTTEISLMSFLTVCQTILMRFVWRICYWINKSLSDWYFSLFPLLLCFKVFIVLYWSLTTEEYQKIFCSLGWGILVSWCD